MLVPYTNCLTQKTTIENPPKIDNYVVKYLLKSVTQTPML
jgi:hypothetical protein